MLMVFMLLVPKDELNVTNIKKCKYFLRTENLFDYFRDVDIEIPFAKIVQLIREKAIQILKGALRCVIEN